MSSTKCEASFYNGTQIDVATVGEHPPQLPGTRKEVEAIAKTLKLNRGRACRSAADGVRGQSNLVYEI